MKCVLEICFARRTASRDRSNSFEFIRGDAVRAVVSSAISTGVLLTAENLFSIFFDIQVSFSLIRSIQNEVYKFSENCDLVNWVIFVSKNAEEKRSSYTKMCGGFTCSKNALTALNILYIVSRTSANRIVYPISSLSLRIYSCLTWIFMYFIKTFITYNVK